MKDERLYWKIRIPRVYREDLENIAKLEHKPLMKVVENAVDWYLKFQDEPVDKSLDGVPLR